MKIHIFCKIEEITDFEPVPKARVKLPQHCHLFLKQFGWLVFQLHVEAWYGNNKSSVIMAAPENTNRQWRPRFSALLVFSCDGIFCILVAIWLLFCEIGLNTLTIEVSMVTHLNFEET